MADHFRTKIKRSIYISDEDYAFLKHQAQANAMSISSYVLATAKTAKIPDKTLEQSITKLKLELGRIGNNINQIARHCNETQSVNSEKLEVYRQENFALSEILMKLKGKIQRLQNDH